MIYGYRRCHDRGGYSESFPDSDTAGAGDPFMSLSVITRLEVYTDEFDILAARPGDDVY